MKDDKGLIENNPTEINQTQSWLEQIIIGLNFCPFAKKEWLNNTIDYHLCKVNKIKPALEDLAKQCQKLVANDNIETILIIYNQGFKSFEDYLDLVSYAENFIEISGYEGVFQLASFHPDYYFDGEDFDDAANFTNRSPYPMLHLLREQSLARVLTVYKNPEEIPDNNIALARSKGSEFFINALKDIMDKP